MSARDDILGRVRRNQPAAVALPAMPAFPAPANPLLGRFEAAVARMGGKTITVAPADVRGIARILFPDAKVVASATHETEGNRDLASVRKPADLADVDVGVVRAAFGVAETGSVWLTHRELAVDSVAFLSQHLVVLLDPAHLVATMHDAYAQRENFEARYGVFMTGPSATADIEGVLIHGAQGIRSLTVALAQR
jgi:L-lactate dehydrogenase complex protein LldG